MECVCCFVRLYKDRFFNRQNYFNSKPLITIAIIIMNKVSTMQQQPSVIISMDEYLNLLQNKSETSPGKKSSINKQKLTPEIQKVGECYQCKGSNE